MEFTEEVKAGLEKVKTETRELVKTEIDSAIMGLVKQDELTQKLSDLKVDDLTIKEIAAAVKSQGEKITEMYEKQKTSTPIKSLPEILKENMAKLKTLQSKEAKTIVLNIPRTALKTNVTINSSITTDPAGAVLPGLNDTGLPATGLELAFQRLTLPADHHGIIRYTDLTTRTNTATYIAEGAQQGNQQTYAWTGTSKTVEKVLGIVPVSWESLTDSVEMELAIRRLLTGDVDTVRQTQLYTGSGSAPQIAGVYQVYAQTFDYAAHTSPTTAAANIYDLLMLLKEQVIVSYGAKYQPDVVLMNPADALAAKWTKDELGNYVRNPFVSPDGTTIAGMRIIESAYVTANTLVVGDSRYAYYYQGDTVEIEMGYEASNFTYDLVSLKARARHCLVIRTADAYGWIKVASVSAALTAITTPTA
jgi:hypothetical protein